MQDEFEFSWDFGETSKLKAALQEIAKPCLILNPDKNSKTHLFKESSERRQEIAQDALQKNK